MMCWFCSPVPFQQLFTSFLPSKHMGSCALRGREATGQQDPTALQCCVRHCSRRMPSAWKCKECPCFLLWCAVNSCFFITHMCGSGTSTNSCFGLVLFSLLIYFWFRDQHRADNNVCMRKWLLAVMRCQTAQCNAKTRSTSIVTLLFTAFQFVFIAMILKISIITDVERQNCCLLCQCMSVTWCKATKAIDSVQIKCINTVFISSSALYRCSYNYRGISVNKVMSKFTQVTWPQNSATYRP